MPLSPRLLALATLLASCPLFAQQSSRGDSGALGRISFWIRESNADAAGRTRIMLHASTPTPTKTCRYALAVRLERRSDTVTIDRWNIDPLRRHACEVANDDTASAIIPLGIDRGRYVLAVGHLGATDRYRVAITDDAIRVAPLNQPRVSVLLDTLAWRFPRQSFAVACGGPDLQPWMCAELLRLMADQPGIIPIDIPQTGRNPFEYDGIGVESLRYFRAESPASVARMRRNVQRFVDETGLRRAYDLRFIYWTDERWAPSEMTDATRR